MVFCNESFLGEGFLVKGYGINVLCFVWEIWVGVIWVLEKGKFSLELIDRVYKSWVKGIGKIGK